LVAMQILAGATGVITDSIDICHETLKRLLDLNINNIAPVERVATTAKPAAVAA